MSIRKISQLLGAGAVIFLLSACDGPAEEAGEKLDTEVEETAEKIEAVQEEVQETRKELEQVKQERQEAIQKLEEAKQERQQVLEQLDRSETENPSRNSSGANDPAAPQ